MDIPVTRQMLIDDLQNLGLRTGDVILVHSSLSSLGYVEGGADTVIDALLQTLGNEGTIMVPTLTGNEFLGPDNPPVFDPGNTPCWTGKIPETFWKRTDAIRSLHPTHSVAAIGRSAEFMLRNHHLAPTPCGIDTPYYRLAQAKGRVLLLGVDLESCTLFHTIEELAGSSYHLQPTKVLAHIFTPDGWRRFPVVLHKYGTLRNFMSLDRVLRAKGIEKPGKIGKAQARLLDAGALIDFCLPRLKEVPFLFVPGKMIKS